MKPAHRKHGECKLFKYGRRIEIPDDLIRYESVSTLEIEQAIHRVGVRLELDTEGNSVAVILGDRNSDCALMER